MANRKKRMSNFRVTHPPVYSMLVFVQYFYQSGSPRTRTQHCYLYFIAHLFTWCAAKQIFLPYFYYFHAIAKFSRNSTVRRIHHFIIFFKPICYLDISIILYAGFYIGCLYGAITIIEKYYLL